uniref:Uncharacterized protein n=1 Tax=Arundo donax TaxID=35708 RepID=A0A0A8Y7L9_ARUDO
MVSTCSRMTGSIFSNNCTSTLSLICLASMSLALFSSSVNRFS